MKTKLLAALSVSAVAGVGVGAALASPEPPAAADKLGRAEALTAAPALREAGVAYTARAARAAANLRAAGVPLPAGGTFNGVRWELAGAVTQREIDLVLQYNAACQWLRAWRDGREPQLAIEVLQTAPSWPAIRGTESAEWLARVAADVRAGGGEAATAVLADCDASHESEAAYAKQLTLTPSR
ncbi:MAG TPA: hypothetical protein VFZ00_06055 [Solirubrobacter sp.]|nr:hypothetical protein [Solirubrobacter sp.]